MSDSCLGRVAILYPGDREIRRNATKENNRFATIFSALAEAGVEAEPAVYHDDFCDEVREQLMGLDAVLVWMNPIQDGRDRTMLDAMLREIAGQGIYVSTHPDIILKMGTKQVLYDTRDIGWGSDTHLYRNLEQMRAELPPRLARDGARVLKQYRGNGGLGVWKLELMQKGIEPEPETIIRVRHAKKGTVEEQIPLGEFFARCKAYFSGQGKMIDQAYQARLPEGMVRCYMVQDKVAGFGHQAVNALYPASPGAPPSEAPQPGPRLYHPPDLPRFQAIKQKVEGEWVPEMQRLLDISTERLPMLWDCDFLLGPKDGSGEDTYVLCEINVSSIAPYPESAAVYVARAIRELLKAAGRSGS
jgi:hypothetical protein